MNQWMDGWLSIWVSEGVFEWVNVCLIDWLIPAGLNNWLTEYIKVNNIISPDMIKTHKRNICVYLVEIKYELDALTEAISAEPI